jgi:hypothetical protein
MRPRLVALFVDHRTVPAAPAAGARGPASPGRIWPDGTDRATVRNEP